jgi:hypothetical protein
MFFIINVLHKRFASQYRFWFQKLLSKNIALTIAIPSDIDKQDFFLNLFIQKIKKKKIKNLRTKQHNSS